MVVFGDGRVLVGAVAEREDLFFLGDPAIRPKGIEVLNQTTVVSADTLGNVSRPNEAVSRGHLANQRESLDNLVTRRPNIVSGVLVLHVERAHSGHLAGARALNC